MSRTAQKSKSLEDRFQHRLSEGVLIVTGALAVFLLVALVTHVSSDPAWNQLWSRHYAHISVVNAGGRAGAFLSDFLLYVVGNLAFIFPLLLFYAAWLYFRYRDEIKDPEFGTYFALLRLTGFVFIVFPGCALSTLHDSSLSSISSGGVIGQLIASGMVNVFNYTGTSIILTALFLSGITLFSGLSWVRLADYLGEKVWSIGGGIKSVVRRMESMAAGSPGDNENLYDDEDEYDNEELVATKLKDKPRRKPKIMRVEPKLQATTVTEERDLLELPSAPPIIQKRPTPPPPPPPPLILKGEDGLFDASLEGTLPPLSLLDLADHSQIKGYTNEQLENLSREVELRLNDFGIQARVVAVHPGPVVTRFELQLAAGTKASRITTLAKDLARSLSVISVRVVEIIPGKSVIGLELPNIDREIVRLSEILSSELYQKTQSPLCLAMGKDIAGNTVVADLAKMPHLLVAGTTGSGKSVGLNAMLLSLLFKATPSELRMILIDPKMLELSVYEGIPHLLTPVVTDMKDAANALRWAVAEMDRRYRLMASLGVRNLLGYNQKIKEAKSKGMPILDPFWQPALSEQQPTLQELPYIMVLVDEFADMMMLVGKKVEELIARIAQKARAAGIHLILATQRPSVDVITGLIKANIPTRISFQVSSKIDSRTILDQQGAEQLLGHGDMLYLAPGTGVPIRIHGAFVADEEVHRVVRDLKRRGQPQYLADVLDESADVNDVNGTMEGAVNGEQDPLYDQAVQIVIETRRPSISHIQRRLKIGYNRAANIVEAMEAAGVVSNMDTSGVREVLVGETSG